MSLPLATAESTTFRGKTVLVTGATGFLGTRLACRLLREGARVRVLARSPERARRLVEHGAHLVVGDICDETALRSALQGAAVIYHLAGRLLVPGVLEAEYRRTHVDGTRHLLSCCDDAPGLERLVHCSTTGVLGATGERPADETAAMAPTSVYELTKAEAEVAVLERCRGGLPAVVARPGLVYGPGDLHLLSFFRLIARRRFLPIGRRAVLLHPIYLDDLIEALLRCGQDPAAVGECFHLAGRAPVSVAELAGTIARAQGTSLPPGHLPLPVARAAASLAQLLPPGLRRHAPLTPSRVDLLTRSRVYDVDKARRLLRFEAPTDLSEGVALTLEWYRQHGHLPAPACRCPHVAPVGAVRSGSWS